MYYFLEETRPRKHTYTVLYFIIVLILVVEIKITNLSVYFLFAHNEN